MAHATGTAEATPDNPTPDNPTPDNPTPDTAVLPLRVLIVEDEPLIAMDLEMVFEDAGHEVVGTARTADHAVAMARAQAPSLVIIDLNLADGTSGVDAARRIRLFSGVAIAFASGNLDAAQREELAVFEPVAAMPKPYMPTELLRAVGGAQHPA